MSFRVKIALVMVTVVAVLFGGGIGLFIYGSAQASLEEEEAAVVRSSKVMLGLLELMLEDEQELTQEQIRTSLEAAEKQLGDGDETLVCRDGKVVYASAGGREEPAGYDSLADGTIEVTYAAGQEKGDMAAVAGTSFYVGSERYMFYIFRNISRIRETRSRQLGLFLRIYLLVLAAGTLLVWAMATWLVRPLQRLKRATQMLSDGDLSYRAKITSHDEIGELAGSFNRMASALQDNVEALEEAADRKDRFMGAFTHELKTPMTSIIGYSQLLLTQELQQKDREDALQYIHSEAKRLESLSLKLLDLFVADASEVQLVGVDPLRIAEDIQKHMSVILDEQGITLTSQTEGEVPAGARCMLEPDLVRTLLLNLIDNARKGIEGRLEKETAGLKAVDAADSTKGGPAGPGETADDGMDKVQGQIVLRTQLLPDGVCYQVEDNGEGIPEEALAHVTEAFYRVDKSRARKKGGAGLGLSLASKIAQLHNGQLRIESEPMKGTVVTAQLRGGRADG